MSSYLLDTEFLHTKAIIIIGVGFYICYYSGNQVMWYGGQVQIASNLICLHAANLMASLWIMATTECYNAYYYYFGIYVYYGIVEFSVRDKQ